MVQRPQQLLKQLSLLGYTVLYEDIGTFPRSNLCQLSDTLFLCQGVSPLAVPHPRPRILWLTFPQHVRLISHYRPDYVIFDCSDEPKNEFSVWEKYWPEMLSQANLVFATSNSLFKKLSPQHPLVKLIPNGVDSGHFALPQARPSDLPKDKPLVGYSGAIAPWLDWDLLQNVIIQNPDFHFIFVGALVKLTDFPIKAVNLSYLGLKPYITLPAYLQQFEIGLIPFHLTDMTKGCNPIKLYEYAATGLPIVATALPELTHVSYPGLFLASDANQFSQALNQAYSIKFNQSARKAFALENDWLKRAEGVQQILQKFCS
jgi:glycosyltransferase involved in cell wall biosynthesis